MCFNLLLLVFKQILFLDVDISLLEPCNSLELGVIVFLMEVHAVREHLLEITDPDGIPRGQQGAVDFESRRVSIVEAPDPDVIDEEAEVSACLEVKGFIFLHSCYIHAEQVWSSNDVSLEFHEVWFLCLDMIVDLLHRAPNFFLSLGVDGVPRSHLSMVDLQHFIWTVPWEDQVNVIVLLSTLDDTRYDLLMNALLESVSGLSQPSWV